MCTRTVKMDALPVRQVPFGRKPLQNEKSKSEVTYHLKKKKNTQTASILFSPVINRPGALIKELCFKRKLPLSWRTRAEDQINTQGWRLDQSPRLTIRSIPKAEERFKSEADSLTKMTQWNPTPTDRTFPCVRVPSLHGSGKRIRAPRGIWGLTPSTRSVKRWELFNWPDIYGKLTCLPSGMDHQHGCVSATQEAWRGSGDEYIHKEIPTLNRGTKSKLISR